jgi:hypothetical protein
MIISTFFRLVRFCIPTLFAFTLSWLIGQMTSFKLQFVRPVLLELYDNTTDWNLLYWVNTPFMPNHLPHLKKYRMYKTIAWGTKNFWILVSAIVGAHGYAQDTRSWTSRSEMLRIRNAAGFDQQTQLPFDLATVEGFEWFIFHRVGFTLLQERMDTASGILYAEIDTSEIHQFEIRPGYTPLHFLITFQRTGDLFHLHSIHKDGQSTPITEFILREALTAVMTIISGRDHIIYSHFLISGQITPIIQGLRSDTSLFRLLGPYYLHNYRVNEIAGTALFGTSPSTLFNWTPAGMVNYFEHNHKHCDISFLDLSVWLRTRFVIASELSYDDLVTPNSVKKTTVRAYFQHYPLIQSYLYWFELIHLLCNNWVQDIDDLSELEYFLREMRSVYGQSLFDPGIVCVKKQTVRLCTMILFSNVFHHLAVGDVLFRELYLDPFVFSSTWKTTDSTELKDRIDGPIECLKVWGNYRLVIEKELRLCDDLITDKHTQSEKIHLAKFRVQILTYAQELDRAPEQPTMLHPNNIGCSVSW